MPSEKEALSLLQLYETIQTIHIIYKYMLRAAYLPFCSGSAEAKDFVVVIDPGHGGHDPGAVGKISKEKNINLNVALKLGKQIKKNCLM